MKQKEKTFDLPISGIQVRCRVPGVLGTKRLWDGLPNLSGDEGGLAKHVVRTQGERLGSAIQVLNETAIEPKIVLVEPAEGDTSGDLWIERMDFHEAIWLSNRIGEWIAEERAASREKLRPFTPEEESEAWDPDGEEDVDQTETSSSSTSSGDGTGDAPPTSAQA